MRVGVVLSGCGFRDGAEIQGSVLTLLALARAGAEAVCFAPDIPQAQVVDHLTGKTVAESRNVLHESARIAGEHVPIRPDTDVFFYLSFLRELLTRGRLDRERIAGYKRPRRVIFIPADEMPRTATGKVLHRVLRDRFTASELSRSGDYRSWGRLIGVATLVVEFAVLGFFAFWRGRRMKLLLEKLGRRPLIGALLCGPAILKAKVLAPDGAWLIIIGAALFLGMIFTGLIDTTWGYWVGKGFLTVFSAGWTWLGYAFWLEATHSARRS